jgi:hypothetical protein
MRALVSSIIGILSVLALSDAVAGDGRPVTSPQAACEILKLGAVRHRLSVRDLKGRYYCDYVDPPIVRGEYYLLGLRYRAKPQERVGSDLVGWFVVRVHDGQLLEYDMGDEQIKPLRPPHQWTK